ncbi:cytidylyltransferase domain-containing protein [Marinicrinis lubricantis]|uniref:Cytidylyltransferase domain-containing protein n=1 Tax=Marinicrinis lubricantis TaxID=2086470 RepID=A0ABW1ISX5_9BACL
MKTIIIIQARMGSSRLPGKVLMPLGNTVVLDYVVSRCQKLDVNEVVVATSVLPQDDAIEQWCAGSGVTCFRGSEDDVLSRYYECAQSYAPDCVIRVTSDCPFVDVEMAEDMIRVMEHTRADYVKLKGDLPRGLAVEVFAYSALEYIHQHGTEPRHREHVTYYGYEFAEKFQTAVYEAPAAKCQPQLRITLDTPEDYDLCRSIAGYFNGDKLVSSEQVIRYLLDHPEVSSINAHIQQKPVE